ncbi:MAG: hypothetical protein KAH06_09545, partial [Desulfobacterales bacterium]|nr:hypothetical protein [Desulfobacterales bacterium]
SGDNLSEDIIIEENYIYVNSTGTNGSSGLNKSAIIRFYNLSFNGTLNILKDGDECGSNCSALFSNGDEEYWFNVTGFSNYSLSSESMVCNQTIYNTLYLNESMVCNQTAVNIGADNVIIDCQGHNITYGNIGFGYGININSYDNFLIRNCELIEGNNGSHSIYVNGNNGEIYNNVINVINENSSALYFDIAGDNNIWNNTLNSTDTESYVVYLINSSLHNLENNSIVDGGRGIKISNGENNTLHNNSISNINNVELNISNSNFNILFAQEVDSYDLKSIVYFETNYSKIIYGEELNQTGINLSSDINISENLIEVASKEGLNKSARLEFYDIILPGLVVPYRNGDWCGGDICSEFEEDDGDYYFNVTGFSNYSIWNMSGCNLDIEGSIILGQNITCGNGVNIVGNNLILDCDGYTISYGNDFYGINNEGYDDVTIKNCILEQLEP